MQLIGFILFCTVLVIYMRTAEPTTEKTVITYNTGLFEAIGLGVVPDPPSRDARRDAIINELKSPANDADVICLQEVFIGEDVNEIVNELASTYPYSFSQLHDESGNLPLNGLDRRPACGYGILQFFAFSLFMACAEKNCDNAQSVEDVISCLVSNCLLSYIGLTQECMACIIISGPSAAEIKQKCSQPLMPRRHRNMNMPGLLLLAKTNMSDTGYVDYHPDAKEYTQHFGYLHAQVADIGRVVCTHATPYNSGMYPEVQIYWYEGISSYEEQGAAQLGQLVTAFGSISPVLLLGDFNVGDAVAPDINATQLANYQIMTSSFQTQSHDQCTFCNAPENAYNADKPRVVVDHVFYNGATYRPGSSERIFDDITVGEYPLSDHFGVKQTFTV